MQQATQGDPPDETSSEKVAAVDNTDRNTTVETQVTTASQSTDQHDASPVSQTRASDSSSQQPRDHQTAHVRDHQLTEVNGHSTEVDDVNITKSLTVEARIEHW